MPQRGCRQLKGAPRRVFACSTRLGKSRFATLGRSIALAGRRDPTQRQPFAAERQSVNLCAIGQEAHNVCIAPPFSVLPRLARMCA